ncbi:MAG: sigma-54 dependent transcriptional regulator [Bacteroidota bacterium]
MKNTNTLSVLRNSPCGIFMADKKLNITFWNAEMQHLSGIESAVALKQKVHFVKFFDVQPGKRKTLDFSQCFKGKKTNIAKTAFLDNSKGNSVLVFVNARFIQLGSENTLVVFVTDISREITCSTISAAPLIIKEKEPLQRIVGRDEKILELYRMIEMAADSMANVNISGESGTGKELVANAIHQLSARKDKPFVKVNCSALSETLLESELFGHVKGSFTGAYKDKVGKFEAAGGGTVFLDEIGEVSQMIQVKLLRVIQEKIIERVGDNKSIKVDMRIITATNKNLRDLVKKGLFREDLFYRLNVFPINTPALRERVNDIPLLVEHFIAKFNTLSGKQIKGLTEDASRIVMDYCWPGNVRELQNSIEHAFVVCNKKLIDVLDLPQDIRMVSLRQSLCGSAEPAIATARFVPEDISIVNRFSFRMITKEQLNTVLANNRFNRKDTAKQLGVSTVALWKKMKKMGILD